MAKASKHLIFPAPLPSASNQQVQQPIVAVGGIDHLVQGPVQFALGLALRLFSGVIDEQQAEPVQFLPILISEAIDHFTPRLVGHPGLRQGQFDGG